MKEILDNLFDKEKNIAQEGGLKLSDDTNTQEETKNVTTDIGKKAPQSEPVVEQVSESENEYDEHIVDEENVVEPICDEVNNEPKNVTFEVFVADLKHILNSTQGLDFELVELKRQINNLIQRYEAHN